MPPELEDLLDSWQVRLPIGTELSGYISQDPDVTVIRAAYPSFNKGGETSAAVQISRESINFLGLLPAVAPPLALLIDLAMRRAMPNIRMSEAAPVLALMTTERLIHHDLTTRLE